MILMYYMDRIWIPDSIIQ